MAQHNDLGKKGEEAAVEYLQRNKYEVLEKNYRYKRAEIDIIAMKDNTLHCIEVKTRSRIDYGSPETFVSKAKIKLLIEAINHYVDSKDLDVEIQFDIISVYKENIEHIAHAFYHF